MGKRLKVVNEPLTRTRIVLADDSPAVEAGIRRLLEPEFEVVESVADGLSLLAAAKKLRPDVVIVDVLMPGMTGLEAVRRLTKRQAGVRPILLSVLCDTALVDEARSVGALGYVLKASASQDLVEAIHVVLAGEFYVSPDLRR